MQIAVWVDSPPKLTAKGLSGGSFVFAAHLPAADLDAARRAGAVYWSEEELEDMDMFYTPPGWYYSASALAVLIKRGYTLRIFDTDVTSVSQLEALFSPEAQAARRAAQEAEERRAAQEAEEAAQRAAEEAARAGAEYAAWRERHVGNLVLTFCPPPSSLSWERIAYFPETTPGAWYTTGDLWFSAVVNDVTVYCRAYGNATACYAPQEIVDQWLRADYERRVQLHGKASVARRVLQDSLRDYMGSDDARRLVALMRDDLIAAANSEEYRLYERDHLGWTRQTTGAYGLNEPVAMTYVAHAQSQKMAGLDWPVESIWRHPDGRLFARGYRGEDAPIPHNT